MKKISIFLLLVLFLPKPAISQVQDRFGFLSETNVVGYAQPLVTTMGVAMNSGSYNSASISKFIGFSFSIRAMLIMVPNDQETFLPSLPAGYDQGPVATIYGNQGGAFAGPNGFIVTPPGINETNIPVAFPQIAASFMGTEVMLRYLPTLDIGETSLSFFGIGISHNISQYFPLMPVDIAVQLLYNKFDIKNIFSINNIAFNAHISKQFGIIIPYFGLQYENTSSDLTYNITGDPSQGDPALQTSKTINVSVDGNNNFRTTLGLSLKLGIIALNADYGLSSQSVFSSGLSFEF